MPASPAVLPNVPPVSETQSADIARCKVSAEAIDPCALLDAVRSTAAGAVTLFVGTVREFTRHGDDMRQTQRLAYDAYVPMAEATMRSILVRAVAEHSLLRVAAAHRTGTLELGEIAVVVAVSSRHRDAAFEGGREILEQIKSTVPIWKQEQWADGSAAWQHPAGGTPAGLAERS